MFEVAQPLFCKGAIDLRHFRMPTFVAWDAQQGNVSQWLDLPRSHFVCSVTE